MATHSLTAIIEREGDGYVALCPELDIASQGDTLEEAKANLQEALELFFESADADEVKTRLVKLGIDAIESSTPESTAQFIRDEAEKWAPIVKASGAQVE